MKRPEILRDKEIAKAVQDFNYSSAGAPPGWWLREYRKMLQAQLDKTEKDMLRGFKEWLEENDYYNGEDPAGICIEREKLETLLSQLEEG